MSLRARHIEFNLVPTIDVAQIIGDLFSYRKIDYCYKMETNF